MPGTAKELGPEPMTFRLSGLTCADGAAQFERSVQTLEGVQRAELNYGAAKLRVWGTFSPLDIVRRASQSGFDAVRLSESGKPARAAWRRTTRLWWTVGASFCFVIGLVGMYWPEWIDPAMREWFFGLALAAGGVYPFRSAFYALRYKALDMNVLMSVAALGAAVIGEWFEGATIILLFSMGEILGAAGLDRARRSVVQRLELIPDQALVVRDGEEHRTATGRVQTGDICLVRPGQRIPVDGIVCEGTSIVDESPVTAETVPMEKGVDDPVYAGTINGEGTLQVVTASPASKSALARVVALVEEAQGREAPLDPLVGRIARLYTPGMTMLALAVAALGPLALGHAFYPWMYRALALLILACPWALRLATRAAVIAALSHGAHSGLVFKGGRSMEALAGADMVAFDKSGTLTAGRLAVTDVIPLREWVPNDVIAYAAAAGRHLEHGVGAALIGAAQQAVAQLPAAGHVVLKKSGNRAQIGGHMYRVGTIRFLEEESVNVSEIKDRVDVLESEGKTVVGISQGLRLVGIIGLADALKEESRRTVRRLLQLRGIERVTMLTGDNPNVANVLAGRLGIDNVVAELAPKEKVDTVKAWQKEGYRVALVGDGLDDAPALAAAHVGIAMGAIQKETALDKADIAVLSGDLTRLPYGIVLARRTMRIIRQNVVFVLGMKSLALGLLAMGKLTLWMAIAGDVCAFLFVTFNGLRLLGRIRLPSGKSAPPSLQLAESGDYNVA